MRTVHAIIVDPSPKDGQELLTELMILGVEKIDRFTSANDARSALVADPSEFSHGLIFVRDEPHDEAALLIRTIMSDSELSGLFVVLTTSKKNPAEILWAFRLGAVSHLKLPIQAEKLGSIVSTAKLRRFRIA